MHEAPGGKTRTSVWVVEDGQARSRSDQLATEEPLEIRLSPAQRTLAVTMRTPGADFDLTAGFLYGEGLIQHRQEIQSISHCGDVDVEREQRHNIVNVRLREGVQINLQPLERHFFTNSSCGVCGKASIDALKIRGYPQLPNRLDVDPAVICRLPGQLRAAQGLFSATGGLHAAALFDRAGQLIKVREDVGRHNALDKLIGSALLADELPLGQHIVMVSGRSSFEILQKCLVAGVPIVCAVSAPSSLAVAIAREFNLTLIGFLRGERFNVYSGLERIYQVK